MWRILLSMISTGSLAAFSAALAPGIAAARGGVPITATPASVQARAGGPGGNASSTGTSLVPPVLKPGQVLPRGSVLNLTV